MEINRVRCVSYERAKDFTGVVYLHEWDDTPFYWGKCDKSFFGGDRRTTGERRCGRYGTSYRHWIEGCTQHGGKLYIGTPVKNDKQYTVGQIEQTLIALYPSVMNDKRDGKKIVPVISFTGDIPASVRR